MINLFITLAFSAWTAATPNHTHYPPELGLYPRTGVNDFFDFKVESVRRLSSSKPDNFWIQFNLIETNSRMRFTDLTPPYTSEVNGINMALQTSRGFAGFFNGISFRELHHLYSGQSVPSILYISFGVGYGYFYGVGKYAAHNFYTYLLKFFDKQIQEVAFSAVRIHHSKIQRWETAPGVFEENEFLGQDALEIYDIRINGKSTKEYPEKFYELKTKPL